MPGQQRLFRSESVMKWSRRCVTIAACCGAEFFCVLNRWDGSGSQPSFSADTPGSAKFEGDGRALLPVVNPVGANYLLYQKIASAIKTTVMIQRMMSLLRLFSSAIDGSTTHLKSRFKYQLNSPDATYGLAARSVPARL